jgi:hypothetical protein
VWRAETHVVVFLGARGFVVGRRRGNEWLAESIVEHMYESAGLEGIAHALRILDAPESPTFVGRVDSPVLHAIVSEHWLSCASIPWLGAARMNNFSAWVHSFFAAAGHENTQDEILRLDDSPWHTSRLAVAYPRALIDAISAYGVAIGARATHISGLAATAWTSLPVSTRRNASAMLVVEPFLKDDGSRNFGIFLRPQPDGRHVEQVVARAWPASPEEDAEGFANCLHRLNWPCDEQGPCVLLDLRHPIRQTAWPAWVRRTGLPQPSSASSGQFVLESIFGGVDRLHFFASALGVYLPHRKWISLKAAFATVLFVGCVGVGWMASMQWRSLHEVRTTLLQIQHAGTNKAPSYIPGKEGLRKIESVNAAVRGLNFPPTDLVRALQPPSDINVGLLNVELVGSQSTDSGAVSGSTKISMKVHAESPTARDMALYVAFLAERRSLGQVSLMRHEIREGQGREKYYRYDVEVAWQE